jgi:hypothetical protein
MTLSKGMVLYLARPNKTNDCLPVALAEHVESEGAEGRASKDRCLLPIPSLRKGRLILPDTVCSVFEQNIDGERFGGRMRNRTSSVRCTFWQIFVNSLVTLADKSVRLRMSLKVASFPRP